MKAMLQRSPKADPHGVDIPVEPVVFQCLAEFPGVGFRSDPAWDATRVNKGRGPVAPQCVVIVATHIGEWAPQPIRYGSEPYGPL